MPPPSLPDERRLIVLRQRIGGAVEAFGIISRHLAAMPGRKTLIWVSGGFHLPTCENFTGEIDRAIHELNDADIAVYAVDARGLVAPLGASQFDPWQNLETMSIVAERTGGQLYYNRNDIDAEILRATDDPGAGYTLGYYLSGGAVESGEHSLKVRALRSGVNLSYRETYAPEPPSASLHPTSGPTTTEDSNPAGVPLTAKVTLHENTLSVRLHLEPESITLQENNGRWQGSAEVESQFAFADGRRAGEAVTKLIKADLSPESRASLIGRGLDYNASLPVPRQAEILRLRVHDNVSGRVGTLSILLGLVPAGDGGK